MNLSRRQLDSNVVNIELTLASIIKAWLLLSHRKRAHRLEVKQLAGASLSQRGFMHHLYLLVTFDHSHSHPHQMAARVWSQHFSTSPAPWRSHSLHRLGRPLPWFGLSTAYAAFVWLLFVYDVRLIRARLREAINEPEGGRSISAP